mgnify:FL=1
MWEPLTQQEIHQRVQNMIDGQWAYMPKNLFLRLLPMDFRDFHYIFDKKSRRMSLLEQRRLTRALRLMENGEVKAVMTRMGNDLEFSATPKPRLGKTIRINYDVNNGFTLKPTIYNKQSYNLPKLLTKP